MVGSRSRSVGITAVELARRYPRLYHMAEAGSWPSIRQHGLLSTSSLLNLLEITGVARIPIESEHRPESVRIHHAVLGTAVVRDQKPMSDADLRRCLLGGMSPREWYELLNAKVFFWLTEGRLETLLGARAYRDRPHIVLVLDTASLLEDYGEVTWLSPMNSGCTKPFAHPRGPRTFHRLATYPFGDRRRYGRNAVVELAVNDGVRNVEKYVIEVRERTRERMGEVVWRP